VRLVLLMKFAKLIIDIDCLHVDGNPLNQVSLFEVDCYPIVLAIKYS